MEKRISGHTGLLALIGSPVGHSGSPAMYNYSFEKLGLDYAYVAFDIKEDKVKDAIAAMKTFNMRGCNVTMPDKVEAAKYMDELSPAAQIIGAVNTIVNDNGKLTGHITDEPHFLYRWQFRSSAADNSAQLFLPTKEPGYLLSPLPSDRLL